MFYINLNIASSFKVFKTFQIFFFEEYVIFYENHYIGSK